MKDQQKSQSNLIPATQKLILSLKQWRMQENYTQSKRVIFLSHSEGGGKGQDETDMDMDMEGGR